MTVNSVLNGVCIDLCVHTFSVILPAETTPRGHHTSESRHKQHKEDFFKSLGMFCFFCFFFLTIRFTGLPARGSFCSPSSQKPSTSSCVPRGVSLMFCDCNSGGDDDQFRPLTAPPAATHTHPTTTPVFSNRKTNPSSPAMSPAVVAGQVKALWQLLASLEPPDPSSPPEWVLPLPNTVGERTTSVCRAGLGLRAMFSSLHGNQWYLRWDDANRSDP